MKWIPDLLFIVCVTLFLIHQYWEKYLGMTVRAADSYLDPLLAMPIILHLVDQERTWFLKKEALTNGEMWGYCVLVVIAGEVIFPLINSNFTCDFLDIILYFAGTVAYLLAVRARRIIEIIQR